MRDNEYEHAEKRKREGRQGGAEDSPQRRQDDSESTSDNATPRKTRKSPIATRMITKGSERATAIGVDEDEPPTSQGSPTPGHTNADRRDVSQSLTINDIMEHLLRTQRASEKKEEEEKVRAQEERTRAQEERTRAIAKENEYKEEIKQLQSTVTALVLDLKSLQESVPNWGSLISSS